MTDLILSSVYNLSAVALVPFVESLSNSGYSGRRIMLCYDRDEDRERYLAGNGWELSLEQVRPGMHPFVQRFDSFRDILRGLDGIRYVLAADCRDVVFQADPSRRLPDLCPDGHYLCASEAITLGQDEWATDFCTANYPEDWPWLKDCPSYCAGTIAGTPDVISELFGNIYRFALSGLDHQRKFPDQPAFNILTNQVTTNARAIPAPLHTGFAATCGTVLNPKFALSEPAPTIDGPILKNHLGSPFLLVHQYDRYQQFAQSVRAHHCPRLVDEPPKSGCYLGLPDLPTFTDNAIADLIASRSVAVVGPSPSLRDCGRQIDSADVVVRLNRGFPVEEGQSDHLGTRTDILYHCLHTKEECGGPIPYADLTAQRVLLCSPYPRGVLPFHLDTAFFLAANRDHHLAHHFIDRDYYLAIATALGTRPNTGIGAILDLLAHQPASLHVYGFTFFRDGFRPTYKILPEAVLDQWRQSSFNGNHHQEPQIQLARDLVARDLITPDAAMAAALDS